MARSHIPVKLSRKRHVRRFLHNGLGRGNLVADQKKGKLKGQKLFKNVV